MKHLFNACIAVLFCTSFFSCEKSIQVDPALYNNINKSKISDLPEIESIIISSKEDKQVVAFFKYLQNSNLTIDHKTAIIYKIRFKNLPTLNGIYVKGLENGLSNKDVFYVTDSKSNTRLLLEREKTGFLNNDYGYLSIRDKNNNLLFNEQIENNRFTKKISINNVSPMSSLSLTKSLNVEWNCSQEKFNSFYQEAKEKCEADWLCDIACSINPCFIAYLAFAVGKCSGIIK